MFDLDPALTGGQEDGGRRKSARSLAFASCPDCTNAAVGLVASNTHLVWREHFRTTVGGIRIQCRATGVPVCEHPPAVPVEAAACKHPHTIKASA